MGKVRKGKKEERMETGWRKGNKIWKRENNGEKCEKD